MLISKGCITCSIPNVCHRKQGLPNVCHKNIYLKHHQGLPTSIGTYLPVKGDEPLKAEEWNQNWTSLHCCPVVSINKQVLFVKHWARTPAFPPPDIDHTCFWKSVVSNKPPSCNMQIMTWNLLVRLHVGLSALSTESCYTLTIIGLNGEIEFMHLNMLRKKKMLAAMQISPGR